MARCSAEELRWGTRGILTALATAHLAEETFSFLLEGRVMAERRQRE